MRAEGLAGRLGPGGARGLAAAVPSDAPRGWVAGPFALSSSAAGRSGGTARTVCALVGRLANADALARALDLPDADPEALIAAGHERWGTAVLGRCRGAFTVALWDRERDAGLVGRDPLGHGGLFVAARGPALLFASEVRPLLDLLPSRPGPDPVAVVHWLRGTGPPEGRTLFQGIRRVPAGRALRLDGAGWSVVPAWRPAGGRATARSPVAALRAGLDDAVARSLGPERTGVLLSGGLDSAAVTALAAARVPLHCYSGTFPTVPEADEAARIAAVREHLGLPGTVLEHAGGSALAPAMVFLAAHGLPPVSPNAYLWRPLAQRAAADGIAVLLDGEGGDELLSCAPLLIADALRAGHPGEALRLARRLPGMGGDPPARWVRRALVHYGLRGALPAGAHRRLRGWRRRGTGEPDPWLTPEAAGLHEESSDPWALKDSGGPRWRGGLLDAVVDRPDALGAHDHLRLEARLCGVEFRHPLRDPDLLEVVLGLDPELAFDPELDRPLARAALDGLVPDAVRLGARKPHFNRPLADALTGPDAAVVQALLTPRDARVREWVRPEALEAPAGAATGVLGLWRVVSLECWLRAQEDVPVDS